MPIKVKSINSRGSSLFFVETSLPNVSLYTTSKLFNGSIKDNASLLFNISLFDNAVYSSFYLEYHLKRVAMYLLC